MHVTTREYFELLITMRRDREGAEALNSLDIIDTKAGGVAGLIGGFSAAAFFIIQLSLDRNGTSDWFIVFSLASVGLLSLSGLLCASSLHIISHFQDFLFADLQGLTEEEKIEVAASKILAVYDGRVRRYLWSLYCLFAGVICLLIDVFIYLASIT